jgi:hypothetical protein
LLKDWQNNLDIGLTITRFLSLFTFLLILSLLVLSLAKKSIYKNKDFLNLYERSEFLPDISHCSGILDKRFDFI